MAETNNFTEITENFDTIKALLNSIRAQGILNTSDVDKLLTGINSKLEKINTEEDIDLIKIFLSELKQNLDERHSVLLSKFGAIESLFSNLLKNSSEMLKSSEVKELFDIVATNLSVFSREVVSQKETLTDITLRLDAMRSDDSQKKEIIKNVAVLKNDIDRLTNGFDSIVLSLNENFKTIIKTIANIDPSENINKFGEEIKDVVNSFNTILSALQMLDKKNIQIEETLRGLATSEDLISAKKSINDLAIQEQALTQSVDTLTEKYYIIDNLADKIDASVGIIASLKTLISENNEHNASEQMDKLTELYKIAKEITTSQQFEEFKLELEKNLRNILESSDNIKQAFVKNNDEVKKIADAVFALDINANFKALAADITKSEQALIEHVSLETGKTAQLVDVNSTRIINEISAGTSSLAENFNNAHSALALLCKKSFNDVEENIINLKSVVKQIDENNVSANNAIFSNITDRLAIFENDLKSSLEKQEESVTTSSSRLIEQISGIKDLSGILDYKIDSSIIEINNAKSEFTGLKSAVENMLALDFTNQVKDFKVDLYAIKQDLSNALENSSTETNDKFSNELFSKYELLVSKLDSIENEFKQVQNATLNTIKNNLDNISSSLIDVISYVSADREINTDSIDSKLEEISSVVNDNNLNYIENVRDVVEVIKTQVDNNLKSLQDDISKQSGVINSTIIKNNESLKEDLQLSYDKLQEIQDNFTEIRNVISDNNTILTNKFSNVIDSADSIKEDFETKLTLLKSSLLERVSDFQKEFTCDNADKINEIKYATENLHAKSVQNSNDAKQELKNDISRLVGSINLNIEELAEQLASTILKVEGANHEIIDFIRNDFGIKVDKTIDELQLQVTDLSCELTNKVEDVVNKFDNLETSVNSLSTNTTNSLTSTLAKILDNFIALKGILATYDEKNAENLKLNVDVITNDFTKLRNRLNEIDSNIDEDFTRQLSLIESNFEQFGHDITQFFESLNTQVDSNIKHGLENVSVSINTSISHNLEQYKCKIEELFNNITCKNEEQLGFINNKVLELNTILNKFLEEQNIASSEKLNNIAQNLKNILDENIELTSADYISLKASLDDFSKNIDAQQNQILDLIHQQMVVIENYINSDLELHSQNINSHFESISNTIEQAKTDIDSIKFDISSKTHEISKQIEYVKEQNEIITNEKATLILSKLENLLQDLSEKNSVTITNIDNKTIELSSVISDKILDLNSNISESINSAIEINKTSSEEVKNTITLNYDNLLKNLSNVKLESIELKNDISNEISNMNSNITNSIDAVIEKNRLESDIIKSSIIQNYSDLLDEITKFANKTTENSIDIKSVISYNNENIISTLNSVVDGTVNLSEELKSTISEYCEKLANNLRILSDNSNENVETIKTLTSDKIDVLLSKIDTANEKSTNFSSEIKTTIENNKQDLITSIENRFNNFNIQSGELKNTFTQELSNLNTNLENCITRVSEEQAINTNLIINTISDSKIESIESITKEITEISNLLENLSDDQNKNIKDYVHIILDELKNINNEIENKNVSIKNILQENITNDVNELQEKIHALFEENTLNILAQLTNNNSHLIEDLNAKTIEFKVLFESLNERLDKDEVSRMNVFQSQLKELSVTFNQLMDEAKAVTRTEVASISETLIRNNREAMEEVEQSIEEKVNSVLSSSADIAAGELQSMEMFTNKILEQINVNKKTIVGCRDFVNNFIKSELDIISKNIEKEADGIINDLLEQTSIMKDFQRDELCKFASQIENNVEDKIFNHISELKNYLDIRTDSTVLNNKLDNIIQDLNKTANDMLGASSKLLEASVFDNSIADLRTSNEILINTMADNLNSKISTFINENIKNNINNQLILFDKKFTDSVIDKYEEIKLIASRYNNSFENIQSSVRELIADFEKSKSEINTNLQSNIDRVTNSIEELNKGFENLRNQISNKALDEAFQTSINQQITNIEELVKEQFTYLEDISELCCNNLPELTEMNTLVKYSITQSVSDLNEKLENTETGITKELAELKTDIITQFLNIFNQISFVAEQEEILDFIQNKHSELITILSHIVTTADDIEVVKDNVAIVDNKIDNLKEDIDFINEKITSIMSSSGEIDYVYSLQDLESDIAGLRLSLNEIKNNNNSKEFEELVTSTNNVYTLVESLKKEFPRFDSEEFKKDFDALNEDIVSISTRTNKLILASDESYKTLQENLQDFKLVINDLDERTRNFSQEVGIERIDNKLGVINNLIQSGAKTNQVFNEVFEYLAEWVDNAGAQITAISNKVETLDDIGQIKVMLEDLKAEAADNSECNELIEALSNVFDKQAKKISSLEAKLDRMIVDTTINNKNNKIDMTPMENTLNKFLVAIDSRMVDQQNKINSLEEKLLDVMSLVDSKNTVQLTKKVGGMDRQIAKLNKSIEKIASHVIEK